MITEIEGRFCRQKNGLPYAARVTVEVSDEPGEPDIIVQCSGTGWSSQGSVEEVSAVGYEDWKQGAVAGVRHALRVAGRTNCPITITRILGMITDTNPTIAGAAAMDAVWKALNYSPSPEEIQRVEQIAFASWQQADDTIPDFGYRPQVERS